MESIEVARVLAVVACLVSVRSIGRAALGSAGEVSGRRIAVLVLGGLTSLASAVGLLALDHILRDQPLRVPNALGATLSAFGGMLGMATLLASRGARGMTEDAAIRAAALAVAMTVFVAVPRPAAAGLGAVRILRSSLPWTMSQRRWAERLEGIALVLLALLPGGLSAEGLRFEPALG